MKSVIFGTIIAAFLAYGAFHVMNVNWQQTAEQRFTTTGARL
jgi:hypothetical protein